MKVISQKSAAMLIQSDWNITTGGFGSCGHPEAFSSALQQRYRETKSPKNLTLLFAAGQGDRKNKGLNKLAHDGLLKRVIGGYWALAPKLGVMASNNKIEAYNWPQGVISHLFRAIASGLPGLLTKIGLNTFVDPRQSGGRLNECTSEALVSLIKIDDREFLYFPTLPINCAIIRATQSDTKGNLTLQEEANIPEVLAQAQAAHNSGGIVIAQVKEIVPLGSSRAQDVKVPGMLVDYVFVAPLEEHWQTYDNEVNPLFLGVDDSLTVFEKEQSGLTAKTVIARRAYQEILRKTKPIVNLGIGLPEIIAQISSSESALPPYTLTVESGAIGGTPAGGLSFGASVSPEAMMDQPSLFDFYDGGGIDIAFLGFGEIAINGDVNVGYLGNKINGVGGFINISQSASALVFCGLFRAGNQNIEMKNQQINIIQDGTIPKFVTDLRQINFNAKSATERGVEVKYITERAVFELKENRIVLTEVAPGLDIQKNVLDKCPENTLVSSDIIVMEESLFSSDWICDLESNL